MGSSVSACMRGGLALPVLCTFSGCIEACGLHCCSIGCRSEVLCVLLRCFGIAFEAANLATMGLAILNLFGELFGDLEFVSGFSLDGFPWPLGMTELLSQSLAWSQPHGQSLRPFILICYRLFLAGACESSFSPFLLQYSSRVHAECDDHCDFIFAVPLLK